MATPSVTPDPMTAAFSQLGAKQAQPDSASADPMVAAFSNLASSKQTQQETSPEQPGLLQRTYETSPIKPLIDMAKQEWDASRQKVSQDQTIGKQTIDLVKNGDFGRAAELLLSHLATRTGQAAMTAPGVPAAAGIAQSSYQHGKQAVQAAGQGNIKEAIAQGAEAVPVAGQIAEQVGEPLGKDIKEGNVWGAVGDVAGGAATIGSLLLGGSPEARSAAGEAIDTVGEAAKRSVSPLKKALTPINPESVQPEVQGTIRGTAENAASEAGVAKPAAKSIVKSIQESADNIYAKSKAQYRILDDAVDGRIQRFQEKLDANRRALRNLTGTEADETTEAKLLKAQKEIEDSMTEAFDDAKKKGVDPKLVDEAKANFKKSQALYDLNNAVEKTTTGMRPDVGNPETAAKNPEVTDPEKFFKRVNDLHRTGRLQDALGEKGADQLLEKANEGVLKYREVLRRNEQIAGNQKIARGVGKALTYGAAGGLGIAGVEKLVRQFIP